MSDSTSQPHLGQPNRARFCHFQKRLITVTFIFRLNKLLLLKFFPERILYFLSIPVFLCQIYEDSSWHRFIHTVKAPATNFNLALTCIARNLISLCVIRCATWSASRKYHRPVCVLRKCICQSWRKWHFPSFVMWNIFYKSNPRLGLGFAELSWLLPIPSCLDEAM